MPPQKTQIRKHPAPEVSGDGYLSDQDGKAGQDGTILATCSGIQLKQSMQVAAQQIELGGLEVLRGLHGAPDALWDFQKEFYLGGHDVELLLPLHFVLQQNDS